MANNQLDNELILAILQAFLENDEALRTAIENFDESNLEDCVNILFTAVCTV